ncbi:uncharacterized protein JCM6883_004401 [Sporobolomyces salmoneus]|uniref:uncharacterized protein n=1 Tax=Sporobolomyces salmoneus TaxID=183962 RepID=UPI003177580A
MFRSTSSSLLRSCSRCTRRSYSTPHPSLTLLSSFLSPSEQSLLLSSSLSLLDSPSRTTSSGRKKRKLWLKSNPGYEVERDGFMQDGAYEFEEGHFDGVIRGYREMLVREGHFDALLQDKDESRRSELGRVLKKVYALLPPTTTSETESNSETRSNSLLDPPQHLIVHLLHLSSTGRIYPHVDNLEAFGRTIVGVSLGGGERVMKFKRVPEAEDSVEGPAEFEVLVPSGSAYVQQEPLRTHYTHEVLDRAEWEGRTVGGTQRLSIMLRDRLPVDTSKRQTFSFS